MAKSILLLALGIAMGVSVAAYAAEGALKPVHSHRTMRQKPIAAPDLAPSARTGLPPPVAFRDPASPWPYPYNVHETDGLSRNPDDCVKWGCIDNPGR